MTGQVTLNEILKTPPIPGNTSGGGGGGKKSLESQEMTFQLVRLSVRIFV